MNLVLIPLALMSALPSPMPTEFTYSFPLGSEISLRDFPVQHQDLVNAITEIDPLILGTTTVSVNQDNVDYNFNISITNDGVIMDPLVGELPFISSFGVNATHQFVSLFNPTLAAMDLDQFGLIINDAYFGFESGFTIPAMGEIRITLVDEVSTTDLIGNDLRLLTLFPIRHLYLRQGSTFSIIDRIDISDSMAVNHQTLPTNNHIFQRRSSVIAPEGSYTSSSWTGMPNDEEMLPHTLFQPIITPLIQAKAWAHYVMFGAGMFAAGRVEEAFRALEVEYQYMDARSQAMLFEQPNTSFQGINERDRLDVSTFREAIGRYNYLAARVPGATGLINPNPSPFPVVTLLVIGLTLIGLFSVFAYVKSRYQKV